MKKKRIISFLIVGFMTVLYFSISQAAIPQKINYQGYLTNASGTAVSGTVTMVLSLYDVETGGTALWTETQSITVSGGYYSVELGKNNPITLPFDKQYFVGVKVGADAEMTPRKPLTSAPYALRAQTASNISYNRYEFVGFSTAKSNGGGGILKFAQMCQTDFPNSRMCTTEEIIKTLNIPAATGIGWVHPTNVNGVFDITGRALNVTNLSSTCNGWTDGTYGAAALTVSTDGKFYLDAFCNTLNSVACCALVP